MRFDNGVPWGTTTKVPSALALWLVGLDIQPVWGRPRQSTDNAVVERSHGTLNGWVEPEHSPHFEALQNKLQHFVWIQRERYPACEGKTRLEAYPNLLTNDRHYDPQQEAQIWSLQAVYDYLATFRFHRKVEVNGRITLLNREYSLGRSFRRQTLAVQMDAHTHQWIVYDEYGTQFQRFPPKDLTYDVIISMTLGYRSRG